MEKNKTGSTGNCTFAKAPSQSLMHRLARRLAVQGTMTRAPPEGPFAFGEPHWQGKLLLREAVSCCCCCCPVFARNPGLAALSGPHCSLRRPRPPLPHSPCTEGGREGGVGKTCLSSPASPPPPFPSQGCWERLRGVCRGLHGQAGRPAGGPVQTCRPVPPAPGSPPA